MEIKVGLLGLGTVGGGVVQLLDHHRALIASRCGGVGAAITRVLVRDLERTRTASCPEGARLTTRADEILEDPAIQVVIELMGGTEPALAYVRQAIRAKKHVVLANKELMARHGPALLEEAHQHGVALLFEASVAGGIPILRAMRESLNADHIVSLQGIVNGTTNYILSRMAVEGLSFSAALQEAQAKGYAEADPGNDIHGVDAMYKLAILIAMGFGTPVDVSSLAHHGIDRVQATDIQYARD
ncbi:MAG TPA: homoserine dehydrogenase, partial [Candidatus Xenobia bacterium]